MSEMGRLQFPSVDASGDAARHAEYLAAVAAVIAGPRAEALEALDLRPGTSLLDAGCGVGEHAIEIAPRVLPGGRVVGLDASEELIQRARDAAARSGSPAEFVVGDIRELPFAAATFDATRCERVLQHLVPTDAATAVGELVRVTRPEGVVQLFDVDHYQTAITASDTDLARRLTFESRATSRYPDAGLFLLRLLREVGVRDVLVMVRAGAFENLAVFDTLQQLGTSLDEMVAAGAIARGRAEAFREDLAARDLAGTFLATMIAYIVTGRKS